jgi:hypothetical protein
MDLTRISTVAELAAEFDRLCGDKSYGMLAKAAKALPMRDGRQPALPSSTLSDLIGGKSVPSRDTVVTYLKACGVDTAEAQRPWLEAYERVAHQHQRRPAGAVRVRDARPRVLGVHAAIHTDGQHTTGQSVPEPAAHSPLVAPLAVGEQKRSPGQPAEHPSAVPDQKDRTHIIYTRKLPFLHGKRHLVRSPVSGSWRIRHQSAKTTENPPPKVRPYTHHLITGGLAVFKPCCIRRGGCRRNRTAPGSVACRPGRSWRPHGQATGQVGGSADEGPRHRRR